MEWVPRILSVWGTGGTHDELPEIPKLNESIYEFYSPGTSPEVEVVFFHGVHCGDSSKAYLETWTSSNGPTSHYWPKTWLAEEFPKGRILSVSYDSSLIKGQRQGRLGLYCTAENLIQDLMDMQGKVAVRDGCPLVLVGHGLGGLIIKAVCLEAKDRGLKTFLSNLKGILFYSTPHLGLSTKPAEFDGALAETLGWGNEKIARLNEKFRRLRQKNKWVTKAILAAYSSRKPQLDVTEASVRFDVDEFYTAKEDIDTICKPRERTSISVTYLIGLISHCLDAGPGLSQWTCSTSSVPHPARTVLATQNKGVLGVATERGAKRERLLFEEDQYYVPMKHSSEEVRNALNSPHVRVVVLHGGPGFGKSSLAKHLALGIQGEPKKYCQDAGTVGTSSQDSCFVDGVIYLTCGKGANVTDRLQELLRHLNVNLPIQHEDELRRKLMEHLEDQKALVILDDVWEPNLVGKLVVPGQSKYLVTTQDKALWSGGNVRSVSIQDLDQEDAQRILGNYAGFCNGVIPEALTEVVHAIINATESHPLALATLAGVIGNSLDKTSEDDWRDVKDHFLHWLKSEDRRAIGFGEPYPRTVYAAMTYALQILDNDAKNLLHTIVLFEGPIIPETIVWQFVQCTQPRTSWKTMHSARIRLESLGLVQRIFTLSPYGDVGKQKDRAFVIHGLRQQVILSTMLDFTDASIPKSLLKDGNFIHRHQEADCERDLAAALCALYGATIIKKEAIAVLGSRFIWSNCSLWAQLGTLFAWLLCVMLEGKEGDLDNQLPTARAATEVFWMLFNEGQLDDLNMTCLLGAPETVTCSCKFLFDLSFMAHGTCCQLRVETIPSATQKLLVLSKDEDEAVQLHAIATLENFSESVRNRIPMVHLEGFLEGLVELLEQDINKSIQQIALSVLSKLALSDETQVSLEITETKVLMRILQTQGLLESVVMFLSKDMKRGCKEAATLIRSLALAPQHTIARCPNCLERLVGLLAGDVDTSIQGEAMWALSNLASVDDTQVLVDILATSGILGNVVMHLSMDNSDNDICERAAILIGNLASARENQFTLAQSHTCVESLVDLLAGGDANIQLQALRALRKIASSNKTRILVLLLGTRGLLDGVVNHLSWKHEESASNEVAPANQLCKQATTLMRSLASAPENQLTIGQFRTCLERLVGLLAGDVDTSTQGEAMWALSNLASSDAIYFSRVICDTPNSIEYIAMHLSVDNNATNICERAVRLIRNLVSNPVPQHKIAEDYTCIERLVSLLARDVNKSIQGEAMWALLTLIENYSWLLHLHVHIVERLVGLLAEVEDRTLQERILWALTHLTRHGDLEFNIAATLGQLERILTFLSKDMQGVCEAALTLIRNLAMYPALRVKVGQFPRCLEILAGLLVEDAVDSIQAQALWTLASLASAHNNQLQIDILAIPGLLERVVLFLSKDMQGLCEGALALISNLSCAPTNRVTIAEFPCCLERLGGLLVEDAVDGIQENALRTLASLASGHNNQLQIDILAIPGLLERVVMFSAQPMRPALDLLREFARAPTNQATILEFPFWGRLVGVLAQVEDRTLQEKTLQALTNLAEAEFSNSWDFDGVGGVCMDLLAIPGLLERVVLFLSKDMQGLCKEALVFVKEFTLKKTDRATREEFLRRLVGLIAPVQDKTIQERTLGALAHLASLNDQVRMDILATRDLLERVVLFLSKDMQSQCKVAVALIRNLALAPNRINIVHFPCCLERLGGLLAEDVGPSIQEEAMWALVNLVFRGGDQLRTNILAIPDLLKRVVLFLSKDMQGRCEVAAALIRSLALAPANKVTIVQVPCCLEMLGELLAADVKINIQEQAISGLANLASGNNDQLHIDILATTGLLGKVVRLLFPDMKRRCEAAARLIRHLAVTGANQRTIVQFPHCRERLISLSEASLDTNIQMQAASALANLGINSCVIPSSEGARLRWQWEPSQLEGGVVNGTEPSCREEIQTRSSWYSLFVGLSLLPPLLLHWKLDQFLVPLGVPLWVGKSFCLLLITIVCRIWSSLQRQNVRWH